MGECLLVKKGGTKEKLPTYTYTGEHQLIVDDENKVDWRIKFFTSGVFTLLSPAKLDIDVFLVGGGGAGGGGNTSNWGACGGGGGGYTTTAKSVLLAKTAACPIAIGAGGIGAKDTDGASGSDSTAFNHAAEGGKGGVGVKGSAYAGAPGGDGGSGGGSGHGYDYDTGTSGTGNGGSDGSDGSFGKSSNSITRGKGQGTTTRAFGEPDGELYSGGGGGGSARNMVDAGKGGAGGGGVGAGSGGVSPGGLPDNMTGGNATFYGGGGGGSKYGTGGSGYQGICIIRNHREATA